jgi:hypothetical protein
MKKSCVLVALLSLGCAASTDVASSTRAGSPRSITVSDPLAGVVASTLTVSAKVVDSLGAGVSSQIINFVVTSGGGSVFAPAVQSSATGVANEQWTLGTKAGQQTLEARWIDPVSGAARILGTLTATANADVPASVKTISDQIMLFAGGSLPIASAFQISAVTDKYGNVVPTPAFLYSTTGAVSVQQSAIVGGQVGVGSVTATAGALSAKVSVYVLDDFRASNFRLTGKCAGSKAADDSVGMDFSSTKTTYLSGAGESRRDAVAVIYLSGKITTWWPNDTPSTRTVVDSLRLSQRTDSIVGLLYSGGLGPVSSGNVALARQSGIAFSGATLCSAAQYSDRRATQLSVIP